MFDTIFLTGFKKFEGVDVNPTQLIAQNFQKNHHESISKVSALDVTIDQVNHYLENVKHEIKTSNKRILNLHLGVGPNKVYYLQSCAYNMKDFRIPDNKGVIAQKEKICAKTPLNQALKAKVDVQYLAKKLSEKYQVIVSNNPGRYLCNYIYFSSMNNLSELENTSSLFVHIPSEKYKKHQENISFITDLINLLVKK